MAPLVEGAEAVVHLAGLAGVRPSFAEPARYARVNVEGTARDARAGARARRRALPLRVELLGLRQRHAAARARGRPGRRARVALRREQAGRGARRERAQPANAVACAARPFASSRSTGRASGPEMAITLFARAVLAGQPIRMFGDGSMRRDFTHVDDIVARHPRRPGERARRVSARTTSGRARPSSCERSSGPSARRPVSSRGWSTRRCPWATSTRPSPTSHARRAELGWEPRIGLREGLDSVLSWVRRHPAA